MTSHKMTSIELDKINVRVMTRFPKLTMERTCAMEKRMREAARNSYRQTLINECEAKTAILEGMDADAVTH